MLFVVLAFYYRTGRVATVKTTEANCRTIPLSQSRTMKKKERKKNPLIIAHLLPSHDITRANDCMTNRLSAPGVYYLLDLFRCVEPFRCVEFFRCVEKPVLYNMPLELLLDQVGNVGTEIPWFTIYILA